MKFFFPLLFFFAVTGTAQTTFIPGDLAVMGFVNDLEPCGLPAESDHLSFVSFVDIGMSTNFFITDNGWETANAGQWGDTEGTLRIFRTGGTIPAGTVITLQARNSGPNWDYSIISPDNNWIIQNVNTGGGPFNIESGGDQVYFLQGGMWANPPGANNATFDGDVLYGFNTIGTWNADGTTHQSNLHMDVMPCDHNESENPDNNKYTSPFPDQSPFAWRNLIHDPANWTTYADCAGYLAAAPAYQNGFQIDVHQFTFGASCMPCDLCSGETGEVAFHLPFGFYDVVYTDGTDTFELLGISNLHVEDHILIDSTTFTIISITESGGGCPFPPNFTSAVFNVPHNNPGTHGELYICPDYGIVPLGNYLGPHDPGGIWAPPLDPIFGQYYSSFWGPGVYYYIFKHGSNTPGGLLCPSDTASVSVFWVDADETTIEIGCDVNGTPTDIEDDRMVITLNVMGTGLSGTYNVTPLYFGVPTGSITPSTGVNGVPTQFILDPGTATTNNLTLLVQDATGFLCEYKFPLPAPGFCSDPCDHSMTAELSGTEEICPNECPDNPGFINIDIDGGHEDFTMDFSLTAVGHPVWNFTNIEIDWFNEFEVCVSNVPAPVFDASSGLLILPQFLTGSEVVFTLVNVYDTYGCTALLPTEELVITINPIPPITTTSINVCRDEALEIDLTAYDLFISPFLDVTWFDGNPYQGGSEINGPSQTNLENVGQLWAYVEDGCGNSIQVPFTIRPTPKIDSIPPIEICTGGNIVLQSIVITDAANSAATYTFHSNYPLDSTTRLNTLIYEPADSTTIYLLANAALCFDTVAIAINVQDYPDFSLLATPCDLLTNTYAVLFTTSADSIHADEGIVFNNPAGQDAVNGIPNDSSVVIEILNPSGLCKDTFLIVAPNCNCPSIAQPVSSQPGYEICEGSAIPVFSVTVDPGMVANWYDVPSGGIPILANSLTFQPANAVTANYYAEARDLATDCYSIRTEIPFVVHPAADLQIVPDQVLCETSTINFNTLAPAVLNGVGGTGSWFDLSDNQPVTGIISPQSGDAWYYLFTSNPGNCISSDTIAAVVNDNPTIDLYNILCDDNSLTFDLLFTSDADVIVSSFGIVTNIPGTDSFSLLNIPFDTDIQFNLENTATGCVSTVSQLAPDCSCPDLLLQTSDETCSGDGNIDLTSFVGFGVSGSWQMVSTPAGSNPATLSAGTLQVVNKDPGLYTLRFIRSVILDNCVDTALLQITLHTSPFVDAGNDLTSCAPDNILLAGTGGGSNVQFTWQTSGSGNITNENALNTTYTPTQADFTTGNVTFTLNAEDQTGFCPDASESIDVSIDASAYFILDNATQTFCDTSDILVDLDDYITYGTTGGHWFFPVGVGGSISGNSIFNPSSLTPGNYTVYYTTSNAVAPCENDTMGVNLIIENCLCPSVALSIPADALCSVSGTQNLDDFLITNEPGTWSIVTTPSGGQPAVLNGSNFSTNNSSAGIYTLRFTLSNPVAGCDEFAEIDLEVIASPTITVDSVRCADDLQSWVAYVTINADGFNIDQGPTVISLGNNRIRVENISLSTDLDITAQTGDLLCSTSINIAAPDCDCTLNIASLPDEIELCAGDSYTFSPVVSGGKGDVTSFWIVGSDSLYQTSLNVNESGAYVFVSFDELGCREEHAVDVVIYEEMIASVSTEDVTCPGDQNGIISINGISGGNAPYFISINGASAQPINGFPHLITGLAAGTFMIEISDGFNCTILLQAEIESAGSESINLGPDQTILIGDSLLIHPVISFTPDSFYWTGNVEIVDENLLDNWISPDVDKSLTLFALDANGCLYRDEIKIRVLLTSSIYVPTIFSPNDDGVNDLIAPFTDPSITLIEYFEIYSRWGELIYSVKDFDPHQNNFGWDGKYHDKPMSPGVFVYKLKAVNKRGKVYQEYGDLTLIR